MKKETIIVGQSAWKSLYSFLPHNKRFWGKKISFQASKCVRMKNSRVQMPAHPLGPPGVDFKTLPNIWRKCLLILKQQSLRLPPHILGNEFMWAFFFPNSHIPEMKQCHLKFCLSWYSTASNPSEKEFRRKTRGKVEKEIEVKVKLPWKPQRYTVCLTVGWEEIPSHHTVFRSKQLTVWVFC